MPAVVNHCYRFGEFTLDAGQKVLLRQGKPLLLAPKVVETLLTLVQNSGRIIEKQDLMMRLRSQRCTKRSDPANRVRGLAASNPFSIAGEVEEAITCLEKSVPFCADRKWLDSDSYLDPLRSLPGTS
jgi:hypothetical protein